MQSIGLSTVKLLFIWTLALVALSAPPAKAETRQFDVPAQPAVTGIPEFARQADVQILVSEAVVRGKQTRALRGAYTVDEALAKLLEGLGLHYQINADRTIIVGAASTPIALLTEATDPARVTQHDAAKPNEPAREIAEIVVTAQKRVERLRDVPVPVTAVDANVLIDSNQMRIQDYYTRIPGLNLTMMGDVGVPLLSIRGVVTGGYVSPTVGIVVDDIPFGASLNFTPAPDIDPSELSRVEVLRGPQGTLYGASSLGGLLKFVTVDPSTERFGGRAQVGSTTVRNGDGVGMSLRGNVNVPLSEKFAIRASASKRQDPGYIDNIQAGQDGVNRVDSQTGRLSALWRLSDDSSLKLSALYQRSKRYGTSDVHLPAPRGPIPGLGDLQQYALIDSGFYDQRAQAYSAVVTAGIGRAQVTSLSGYNVARFLSAPDGTSFYGNFMQTSYGVRGGLQWQDVRTNKFSQELRLSMPLGSRIESLIGAFYTDEEYPSLAGSRAIDPATREIKGEFFRSKGTGGYSEHAVFADFTFQITDRFDVQLGGRSSRMKTTLGESESEGLYNTVILRRGDPFSAPDFVARDSSFTYLLTPRLRISQDTIVYARMASGYRPGGPNLNILAKAAGFGEYGPDMTENYEIGLKGAVLDRRLTFDASVYYINWKDVQLQLRDPGNILLSYNVNAGKARSRGAELSLEMRPLAGLAIAAWCAYDDAEFVDVPTSSVLTAHAGDRLPYSAPWSGSISIDQDFPISNEVMGFVGASASYVGERKGRFFTGVSQGTFPQYTQLDVRAGAKFSSWTINAFVNNVADERGVLRSGRDSSFVTYAVTYTQPRTAGISLTRDF